MQIKYGKQIDLAELKGKEINLFLLAGNHEKRVFSALNKIKTICTITKSIVLCYKQSFIDCNADERSRV